MNKKIRITIKADGINLKTDDATMAQKVLETIADRQDALKVLKNMFPVSQDGTYNSKTETTTTTPVGKNKNYYDPKKARMNYLKKKRLEKKEVEPKEFVLKPLAQAGFKSTWSEEQDLAIINSIKAGLSNTEISSNPVLLKNHTVAAIITRVSGIKMKDKGRVSIGTIAMAKKILNY